MTSAITCSEKTNSIPYNFMEVSDGMHIVIRGTDGKTNGKLIFQSWGPSVLKFEIIGFFRELMTCPSLSNAHLRRLQ